MTAPKLKPCPFCGGEVKLVAGDEAAFIQCLEVSGHRAIFLQGDNAIRDEVVEMWNTLTDLPQAKVAAAYEAAAIVAQNACLVPPDGGSPTEDERIVCEEARDKIRVLTPADATAAMQAMIDKAVGEERARCATVARMAMVDNNKADELTCSIIAAAIREGAKP